MKRRGAARLALALWLGAQGLGAGAAEVHGASEAFAGPGVVMAWGILRGADDASTRVVLRMEVDATYADVAVLGVNPFTHASRALVEHASGSVALAASRAQFAQFPRTEIRLYRARAATAAAEADLVVYYLGVPDTTPEFADAGKLDAYLDERLARLRATVPQRLP